MLEELQRWLNLGAFERVNKKHASNVIDARWVLKWKIVNDKRIIQARRGSGFQRLAGSSAVHLRRHNHEMGGRDWLIQ